MNEKGMEGDVHKQTKCISYGFAFSLFLALLLLTGKQANARRWLLYNYWSLSVDRVCTDGADIGYRYEYNDSYAGSVPPQPRDYFVYIFLEEQIGSGTMTVEEPTNPPPATTIWLYNYDKIYWDRELSSGDRVFVDDITADVRDCKVGDPFDVHLQYENWTYIESSNEPGMLTSSLPVHPTDTERDHNYDVKDMLIRDVNVRLQVDHEYDSVIQMQLTSPNDKTVVLTTQVANPGSGFGDTTYSPTVGDLQYRDCGYEYSYSRPLVFDDDSSYSLMDSSRTPPYGTVNYKPEEALSAFNGDFADGEWTLEIIDDDWDPETSSLLCWALDVWGVPIYEEVFFPLVRNE